GGAVSRHFNFGNYRNVLRRGVSNNLFDLLLSVKAARLLSVSFFSPSSDFCEFRVRFDFNAPTLVVGEMPMQSVELVLGHHIDEMLCESLAKEVAGFIEHN